MGSHKTSATLLNKRGRDGILEIKKEIKKQFDDDLIEMLGNYEIMPFVWFDEQLTNGHEYFSVNIIYEPANTREKAKVERLDCFLFGKTVDELIYAIHNFISGYKMKGRL